MVFKWLLIISFGLIAAVTVSDAARAPFTAAVLLLTIIKLTCILFLYFVATLTAERNRES